MTQTISSHRVLYLTYDGLTDHIGQSQILPYLLAAHRKGIAISILSFEKENKQDKVHELQMMLRQEGIEWNHILFSTGGNLSKLKDFVHFITKAFSLARKGSFGVIHTRSYFAGALGLLLKVILKKKLLFDKRDFWIDAKVETGRLNVHAFSGKVIHSALRFIERQLFRRADHIISLTHRAKEIVLQQYPDRKPEDITVIPCCVDLAVFNPGKIETAATEALRAELGMQDAFVLGYVGSVDPAYKIPELFQCFRVIQQRIPHVRLLMLVNNDREEVMQLARKEGLKESDVHVSSAPRDKMPLFISVIDCGFYFIMPSYAKQATSPTKLAEILAMRKQVVTNRGVGDAGKIFDELQCGYLIGDFTATEYEKAAQWLAGHQARQTTYDLNEYALETGAKRYFNVYERMLTT